MFLRHSWAAVFACLLASGIARAALTGGPVDTTTAGAAQVNIIHDTVVTKQLDIFSLDLRSRLLGGNILSDQFFTVPLTDALVQTAITQSKIALTGAGAVSFTGPTLLSDIPSLLSSNTSTVQNSRVFSKELVGVAQYVGPQTFTYPAGSIYYLDPGTAICQSYTLTPPAAAGAVTGSFATFSGCMPAQTTFFVPSGTVDTHVSDLGLFDVFQTTTTTNTILHTQVYELSGLAPTTVPEPSSSALLFLGLSAIGSRVWGRSRRVVR